MCGLAGSFGSLAPVRAEIRAALDRLNHRGPDAAGHVSRVIGAFQAHLLHTRLAIIDLDDRANQPFVRDGIVLAFNGEIYNYVEIARDLAARGVRLATKSDTEVLLEAYRHWGLDALDRLEGMWAFALLDTARGQLILCRDRFGEKPLFVRQIGDTTYFGSEPKAIEALSGQPLQVNMRHVGRYLVNGFRSLFKTDETFFEGLEEIPPATVRVIGVDGPSDQFKYWNLSHAPASMTGAEAVSGVRDRLQASVDLRMRADVPLAFCLSGGVDSTALVSLAARQTTAPVSTFSVIDRDERYDESANIARTVEALGCDHVAVRTSTEGFFDRMGALVSHNDAPVPTISYYVHSFLSEAISARGFRVAVSGTGADELFTGYYDHYSLWLAERADLPGAEARLAEWQQSYGRWINNPLLQDPLLFHSNPGFREHLFQNRTLFNSFMVEPVDEGFAEVRYCENTLRNRMLNELSHEIVPIILRADDMNSMHWSVENRSPFLDRGLAEFANRIPNDLLIQDGLPKWPLRAAVEGIAPEAVRLDTRKRGFNASIDSLVDRSDPETRDRLLADGPIFDLVRRDAIEDFLSADLTDNSFSKFLFYFVSAMLFLDASASGAGRRAGLLAATEAAL